MVELDTENNKQHERKINMKKNWFKLVGVAVAVVALGMTAQAVPINGSIAFSDHFTANGTFPSTSTALTSITAVTVSGTEGDFSGIANGTSVNFSSVTSGHPFTFSPSTPYVGLWSIVIGATTYSFDVTGTTTVSPVGSTLVLEGTGVAHISNMDDTAGTWNLTLNQNGGLLNFSGGATVPDGGMTAMLLGGALSALGLLRRKLIA
jgi:VPDSG-CTERM motif